MYIWRGRWWTAAEKPWQMLAACMEVRDALASGNPTAFLSRMPVQMDGSCNGLQHYAALGRDRSGGNAVNLRPALRPQVLLSCRACSYTLNPRTRTLAKPLKYKNPCNLLRYRPRQTSTVKCAKGTPHLLCSTLFTSYPLAVALLVRH